MKSLFILPVLAVLTILAVGIVSAIPICATVETTYVSGIITDQSTSNPISGASVSVDCNGNVESATSDANGGYVVEYSASECDSGDDVTVSATYDGLSGESSDVAWYTQNETIGCLELIINVGCVDVPLIPEFGLLIGGLTVVSAITLFFFVRRK